MPDKKSDNNLGLSVRSQTPIMKVLENIRTSIKPTHIPPSLLLYEYIRGKFLGIFPPFERTYNI